MTHDKDVGTKVRPAGSSGRRGVVVVTGRSGRFLAIRRGPSVAAGGTICFPGGHIEPGEHEADAVVRECFEEVAAQVEAVTCVWRNVSAWGTDLAWWTATLLDADRLTPHPVEVSEILWLSAEEMLAHPDLLPGNRPFLEAVIRGQLLL